MLRSIIEFCKCEHGAVTVDWVVLTAFVAFMGGVVALYIAGPVIAMDAKNAAAVKTVGDQVEKMEITVSFSD
ncbi:hypothetical protein [Ruegeria atlantica]|uniref:hypothetical protein n=1 Tax=Ruegeria atlantica TaxID=81569 RepID=UPI0015837B77|nr:hypothetical protein [Ruegeria atlantica]